MPRRKQEVMLFFLVSLFKHLGIFNYEFVKEVTES